MYKKMAAIVMAGVISIIGLTGCSTGTGGGSSRSGGSSWSDTTAAQASGSADITLKFAHADNETSIFHQGALAFKEKVEELSGGAMQVQIYPSGQMGTLADAAQGIQMGTIDVAPISSTVLANFCPDIAVYDLPFIIENEQQAYASLDGGVGSALAEDLADNNMLCKGWWTLGYRNTTCNKNVKTIQDMKGLKIRTQDSQIHMAIFEALGINATPMGFSELFTALQQGTVDGQENPYVNILQSNIYEVNKTLVETEHVYQVAGLLVSPATYDKLNEDQKKIIDEAGAYATVVERKACKTDNEAAREALAGEHGMTLVELDKSQLREMTAPIYDQYPQLKDLADKVKSYR